MKKLKIAALSVAALGFLPVSNALAQAGGIAPVVPPSYVDFNSLINSIINWAFGLIIVAAALMIMYAAVRYLMAGADEKHTESAKKLIIYAVVAIVVAFVARALVALVRQILGA